MGRFFTTILAIFALGLFPQQCYTSKVFELSDRFPEIRKDGGYWLVKFYAPWCGHCKKLEPIWMHVAQALTRTNIKVGKVDVTRFPSVANVFNAYATPTIKFIKPDGEHTYHGDRTKESIVNYATRMAGPPVQEVTKTESITNLKNQNQLFFMYVGKRQGPLWDVFFDIAVKMQPYAFFYSTTEENAQQHVDIYELPAVFVHKEGAHYFYQVDAGKSLEDAEHLNRTLYKWINEERFDTFPKISSDNINEFMQTGKYIVLAIVEENKVKRIPPEMLEFRDKVESLIRKKRDVYHQYFQFGWMGNANLANSIAMERLPLPYLLVLNSNTYHHHVPEDDPPQMTIEAIETFLEKIMNDTSPVYGGNSIHVNVARKLFDLKRSLEDMWQGNPVLLMVLFTLPSIFFLLILWACCCADILDADDEEEEEELLHEKYE